MNNTSLVIPAYNEEKRLGKFLESIFLWLSMQPVAALHEIIVVDDGSSDKTFASAEKYKDRLPNFRVIRHARNEGKGAAVQTGILAATGDWIVFTDADGATPISELPKMFTALEYADIAVGNRWMPGSMTARHSYLRQFSGWLYRQYMSVFGLGDVDTMCGFKGFKHAAARDLFANLIEKRWLFDTEVAYKAAQRNYSVQNFPIEWTSMDGSKLNPVTLLQSALQIWPLLRKIKRLEIEDQITSRK